MTCQMGRNMHMAVGYMCHCANSVILCWDSVLRRPKGSLMKRIIWVHRRLIIFDDEPLVDPSRTVTGGLSEDGIAEDLNPPKEPALMDIGPNGDLEREVTCEMETHAEKNWSHSCGPDGPNTEVVPMVGPALSVAWPWETIWLWAEALEFAPTRLVNVTSVQKEKEVS